MIVFCKLGFYHGFMKPDLRISIKDFSRKKNFKVSFAARD